MPEQERRDDAAGEDGRAGQRQQVQVDDRVLRAWASCTTGGTRRTALWSPGIGCFRAGKVRYFATDGWAEQEDEDRGEQEG